ncbi:enoyl-CoA hydratase [Novosphingobium barchaimii LL02]|uniref:Enoyl-CoA hydratase n=1 Tax=Novosphingobium barchaimii LL02 TaxID=1114963 RepID=A0A0J7XPF2_9SPHN|nr:enoyl-CoA hydratase-related protein [Novosphingobium barchaimii]KMS53537.1 enoyl-CoA hydratase [Novosphingobium barchaimii LL02]
MTDTVDDVVLFEIVDGHIGLVTLNRPEKRNAVNGAVARAIDAIVKQTEADPAIWAVVITSAEGPTFCAGADLAEVAAGRGDDLSTPDGGFAGFVEAVRVKPWIAAVKGSALGGGLEISLACDLRVVADTTVLGLPEVKRGLIAGAGGIYRLPRQLPRAIALEMIATGEPIAAPRAAALGLVNRVVAEGEVIDAALGLARAICANSPVAVRESLQVARSAADVPESASIQASREAFERLMLTDDFVEGPRAFVEKRPPQWSGC